MDIKRVVIGSDHAGYELKEILKEFFLKEGYELCDAGPDTSSSVDYPDFAVSVSRDVSAGKADLGVLVCGTGLGMSISANKIPGIRAALLYGESASRYARAHNNANVVIFGARTMTRDEALRNLRIFLGGHFEGGRHKKRIDKITAIESRTHIGNGGEDVLP